VWLVELQELRNASLLPPVIMTALGMRDQAGRSAVSMLVDYLEDKELLLLLTTASISWTRARLLLARFCAGRQASVFWLPAVSRSTSTENSSIQCHRSRFPTSVHRPRLTSSSSLKRSLYSVTGPQQQVANSSFLPKTR
jgi:hypothetical protein